jgi:hypothetical protein
MAQGRREGEVAPPPPPPPSGAAAPTVTRDRPRPAPPELRPPPERSIAIEGLFGYAARLNQPNDGSTFLGRNGTGFQLGGHWGPSRLLSIGLVYSRSQAGSESLPGSTDHDASRNINAILAELRVFPLRGRQGRLFAGLQAGLGWESADFTSSGLPLSYRNLAPINQTCSTRGNLGPAGGVNLGGEMELGHNLAFVAKASASVALLGTKSLGDAGEGCGDGGGHMTTFDGRIGLQYRFGLGG